MFRAYGTAPAETPSGADLYSWTTPIFNKGFINCNAANTLQSLAQLHGE
ncbi:unnamed protein product [Lasius platythorax]|uniref:Uncharacterized protein n=1 Tax=Lasius platythorax TaxID=488582 RepID=A0AAV2N1P5_9HYME